MPTSFPALVRALIAVWITLVLVRAAWTAWRHRDLVGLLWRGIDLRTVGQAFGLLVVVLAVASLLLGVPGLDLGVGSLLDFQANAVFAPLEQAVGMTGAPPPTGPDWALAGMTTVFLGGLALLIPWLAFIEEEVFRAGLEATDRRGRLWSALRFGLVHLVMLVPLAAALAIAVAGWFYGRRYLHVFAAPTDVPQVVRRAYRPGRTGVAALRDASVRGTDPATIVVLDDAVGRQVAGVTASARLHAAFNLEVIALVWLAIVTDALTR